jgi:hypothetical protein
MQTPKQKQNVKQQEGKLGIINDENRLEKINAVVES